MRVTENLLLDDAFSGLEVLERALIIIDHGEEACPWCALAVAKEQLDEEHGTGLQTLMDVQHYFYDEVPSDRPLGEAREALSPYIDYLKTCGDYTRQDGIRILSEAIVAWKKEGLDDLP